MTSLARMPAAAKRCRALLALTLFVMTLGPLLSCNQGPELGLLQDGTPPDWSELRRRLNIRVLDAQRNPAELTPNEFLAVIAQDCRDSLKTAGLVEPLASGPGQQATQGMEPAGVTTCRQLVWTTELLLCAAHRQLELASAVTPSSLETAQGVLTVPPQDTATQAGLQESALRFARGALVYAGEGLRSAAGKPDAAYACAAAGGGDDAFDGKLILDNGRNPPDAEHLTLGEALASGFAEASELTREATERAFQSNLAVADAAFSEVASASDARKQAFLAPVLSRGHAADVALGGPTADEVMEPTSDAQALPALAGQPLGILAQPVDPGVDAALQVLREAAPDPTVVMHDAYSLDDLIAGHVPRGNLRLRLRDLYQVDPGVSADEVLATFGLTRGHMLLARQRMQEQIRAFDRDLTRSVPARQVLTEAGTRNTRYRRYAASSTAPQPPPASYWSALSLRGAPSMGDPSGVIAGTPPRPDPGYAVRGSAQALDYAISVASELLQDPSALSLGAGADRDRAVDALAPLLAQDESERPARLLMAYQPATSAGPREAEVVLLGHDLDPQRVVLVRGRDGLLCATTGLVENQPCNLGAYFVRGGQVNDVAADTGFSQQIMWDVSSLLPAGGATDGPAPDPDDSTFFAVKIPKGATLPPSIQANAGAFVELAGAFLPTVGPWLLLVPANPWAAALAGGAIEPDTDNPAWPKNTCAGFERGFRIPLENSLSSDADPLESSWRTYLNLARQASSESDALGEQLIQAGLELDLRAEGATDELERLCGSGVDLDPLAVATASLIGPACAASADCSAGQACHAGHCVVDPVAGLLASDPDADSDAQRRLRECLGGSEMVPLVSLGQSDKRLCVWRDTRRHNQICEGESDRACPDFCNALVTDLSLTNLTPDGLTRFTAPADSLPANSEVVEVAAYLGLFRSDQPATTGTGPGSRQQLCQHIGLVRTAANLGAGDDALADAGRSFINSRRDFDPSRVFNDVQRISFTAKPGNHFDLRVGNRRFTTGDLFQGVTPRPPPPALGERPPEMWPCYGPAQDASFCSGFGSDSLFCQQIDCTHASARADFAQRLGTAAVAARTSAGASLDRLVFPGPIGVKFPGVDWSAQCSLATHTLDGAPYNVYACHKNRAERQRPGSNSGVVWPMGNGYDSNDHDVEFHCLLHPDHTGDVSDHSGDNDHCGNRNLAPELWIGESCFDSGVDANEIYDWAPPGYVCVPFTDVGSFAEWDPVYQENAPMFWAGFQGRSGAPGVMANVLLRPVATGTGSSSSSLLPDQLASGPHSDFWRRLELIDPFEPSRGTFRPHAYSWAQDGLDRDALADGAELACEAGSDRAFTLDIAAACGNPGTIDSLDDLPRFRAYLRCIAQQMEQQAERNVFANVPRRVVDAVSAPSGIGAVPATGGQFAQEVTLMRRALLDLPGLERAMAATMRQFEESIERTETQFQILKNEGKIDGLQLRSTISQQLTGCTTTLISTSWSQPGSIIAAAAVCANSLVQISLATRIRNLESDNISLQEQQILSDLGADLNRASDAMSDAADALRQTAETLDGALAAIESTRTEARRAVARALFADSDSTGRHYRVNTVMRRRLNTLQTRYERAQRRAVQMAYLARVALEQRLGFDLSEVDWDPSLVESPRGWADAICELSGIDYARLRESGEIDYESFEERYVGDYVRKLEDVVESYRLDFPFSDGADMAVISLRDDVQPVRQVCEVTSPNLLYFGSDLARVHSDEGPVGWSPADCEPVVLPSGLEVRGDCVTVTHLGLADGPVSDSAAAATTPAPPNRVVFGRIEEAGQPVDGARSSLRWQDVPTLRHSRLAQPLPLAAGRRYRLSYYVRAARDAAGAALPGPDVLSAVSVRDRAGAALSFARYTPVQSASPAHGWQRVYGFFDTFGATEVEPFEVAIEPAHDAAPLLHQAIDLAGLMVEDVTEAVVGRAQVLSPAPEETTALPPDSATSYDPYLHDPGTFLATGGSRSFTGPLCEDTEGVAFRSRRFRRVCERVCADGLASCGAGEEGSTVRCFWETDFFFTYEDIAQGRVLRAASPARGNYNYRTDTVAVNFVGTAIHDCTDSLTPSTCFASGFVPYTLLHSGGFDVLDANGSHEYQAPLFNGRIVHGRGLAAERYLTNPVSGADRALLADYQRQEMAGRPLAGKYTLRIWDGEALHFERIEDVQIVLGYRYWTRLN